jgi:broad specificity phosphatase PhoE
MRAALYVSGRIVVADSHLACYQTLSEAEQHSDLVSGFFDPETQQFISDEDRCAFYEKELYLIRHGKAANTSDPDPDISDDGVREAEQAAAHLAYQDLHDFVGIASPLLRCLKTAALLQKILHIHFEIMPEVMETPNFLQDGEIFKLHNRSHDFPQFDWPHAKEWHVLPEHTGDFYGRVKDTLQRLPARSIVVTHYGFICLTSKIALCKAILQQGIPTGSITYFHRHDGKRLGKTDEEVLQDRPEDQDREARRSDPRTASHPGQ